MRNLLEPSSDDRGFLIFLKYIIFCLLISNYYVLNRGGQSRSLVKLKIPFSARQSNEHGATNRSQGTTTFQRGSRLATIVFIIDL